MLIIEPASSPNARLYGEASSPLLHSLFSDPVVIALRTVRFLTIVYMLEMILTIIDIFQELDDRDLACFHNVHGDGGACWLVKFYL